MGEVIQVRICHIAPLDERVPPPTEGGAMLRGKITRWHERAPVTELIKQWAGERYRYRVFDGAHRVRAG